MRSLHKSVFVLSAAVARLAVSEPLSSPPTREGISTRGSHVYHVHTQPLLELNETEVLLHHAPTPPSYYTLDWEDATTGDPRHPGLLITHAVFMSLAFFAALPAGIALRSVKHPGHVFAVASFWAFVILGCSAGGLYKKMTPNMYAGSQHGSQGYIVLTIALSLAVADCLSIFGRILTFVRQKEKFRLTQFWRITVLGHDETSAENDYIGLMTSEPQEMDEEHFDKVHFADHVPLDNGAQPISTTPHHGRTRDDSTSTWINDTEEHRPPLSARSHSSEDTFHDDLVRSETPRLKPWQRLDIIGFAFTERLLVLLGMASLLSGTVVYLGGCRGNYLNGCLAHLIKGGIFWVYGLVTFARFLGSFAEYGWAWNHVDGSFVSAEFTESAVIFAYGITNTWMERFGAHPGDPFTTKQLQHIGIAVMFWFAGLVGMGIESKRIRQWLSFSSSGTVHSEPSASAFPCNPFPSLVIGVTGLAMSRHAQTYLFQVQIHSLWGQMLVAFAVLRCLTYFFLWVKPPRSGLPSRPPTEALGSFFLACGGLEFMFSTEELTIAAMRRGRDDVMMFMCVGIGMTCFAFCWTMAIVAFKGWLKSRPTRRALCFGVA